VTPTSLAHVLEIAALALQAAAGCPVTFSRTQATVEPGVYQVVVEYTEEAVGRLAFELAQALLEAAVADSAFDLAAAIAALRETRRGRAPGPEHRLDRACGRRARHPLPPPDRRQPGAVRLGRASSAASRPPRSTRPAPSPSRSRRTRT
jgi:hypothetical protein